MKFNKLFDAVVVGSGPGGSTLALGLVQRGLNVILVEQGHLLRPTSGQLSPELQMDFVTASCVGGQSKYYGAALYRFRESDFEQRELENGTSPGWPVSYRDLEPYYCEGERLYKVHGSDENDIHPLPRSQPWPHPPIPHQGPVKEMVERLKARSQTPVSYIPKALDYGVNGNCVLCQNCDSYYCPRDAKMDAETAALRPALATGKLELLTETTCIRVLTSADGKRATGVRVLRENKEFSIHAPIVALCANATQTPTILWRSRRGNKCKGLANSSGALGRYMAAHTQGWVFPLLRKVQQTPFHAKTFAITAFCEPLPNWPYPPGLIQAGGHIEVWQGMKGLRHSLVKLLLKNSLQVFYMSEGVPTSASGFEMTDSGPKGGVFVDPAQNTKTVRLLRKLTMSTFQKAGYRVLAPKTFSTLWHTVGTARMGRDPAVSVIDKNCQTYDVKNLFIIDSSALPSASCVNTALTVIALALRGSDQIPDLAQINA